MSLAVLAHLTRDTVQALAIRQGVCIRPQVRRVLDRDAGTDSRVLLACGATREAVCPPCARKARILRMQQCAEGWHRDTEPDRPEPSGDLEDQADKLEDQTDDQDGGDGEGEQGSRRVRSTRRRSDVPDLPRVPMDPRTVGRTFTSRDGKEYRPSMFLTLTLPSYGAVVPGRGVPAHPGSYDYRRAALDALHFAKLVDRLVQNLRRCAGYRVQYFAAIEPQNRLAPHVHMAIRGTIPRAVLRQAIKATYASVWWPAFDQAVYVQRQPVWTGDGYCDPDTGVMLPTWAEAL